MGLLDGDIQAVIGDALEDILLDATYYDDAETVNAASGTTTTTTTSYSCKALVDMAPNAFSAGQNWQAGDRRVLVTQTSLTLTTPAPGDRILVRGETFEIISVDQDPAQALWMFQGRK